MRPPIVLPAELGVSLEELFRAVDRGAVPELTPLCSTTWRSMTPTFSQPSPRWTDR